MMSTIPDEGTPTIPAIRQRIEIGRTELHTFLGSLTVAQREEATDAAGWTVNDHSIHLAVWEKRPRGILTGQKFPQAMRISDEIWAQGVNTINAFLQARDRHLWWGTVMTALAKSHALASQEIAILSDVDLLRPFSYYQPDDNYDTPIKESVMNNTFKHYGRHLEWTRAIVEGERYHFLLIEQEHGYYC